MAHEPWLVVLSLAVAIQGAYVGLSLAVQVGGAVGLRRRLLLAAAAISLAVAIWSIHFVAMLAVRLPFPIDYLVFPTLLSFLVCVPYGIYAVRYAHPGPPRACPISPIDTSLIRRCSKAAKRPSAARRCVFVPVGPGSMARTAAAVTHALPAAGIRDESGSRA